MGDFEIKPLTPATWEAVAALAQKHNGVWGGCWCTYFPRRTRRNGRARKTTVT